MPAPASWGRTYTRWRVYKVKGVGFWVYFAVVVAGFFYNFLDTTAMAKRMEVLVSMCDERARMLQDQFTVNFNHAHSLTSLISFFLLLENELIMVEMQDGASRPCRGSLHLFEMNMLV